MNKSAKDLTQKELTKLLHDKEMNLKSQLFEIASRLEEIIYKWDSVSYAVGTADQYKAEEAVNSMLRSMNAVVDDIEKCRRSF